MCTSGQEQALNGNDCGAMSALARRPRQCACTSLLSKGWGLRTQILPSPHDRNGAIELDCSGNRCHRLRTAILAPIAPLSSLTLEAENGSVSACVAD